LTSRNETTRDRSRHPVGDAYALIVKRIVPGVYRASTFAGAAFRGAESENGVHPPPRQIAPRHKGYVSKQMQIDEKPLLAPARTTLSLRQLR
jgi:hypothetical protein